MRKATTQNEKVLKHLQMFGSIDPVTALKEYSIMRLSARIGELQKEGHNIESVVMKSKNRFGEDVRYAKYNLIK